MPHQILSRKQALLNSLLALEPDAPVLPATPILDLYLAVRGRAVVFHLNHPVASRAQLETNQHRLEETLRTRRIRAIAGLDQHTAIQPASA